MFSGTIYRLTFGNGKVYIGQTRQKFDDRLSAHKCNSARQNSKLYNGWRKNGLVATEAIFHCDPADLDKFEIQFIAEYDSHDNGYNSTLGGDTNKADSYVWRESNLKAMKKLHADPVYRAGHTARMQQRFENPEYSALHTARMKERHADPEFRAAHLEGMKKMHSDPVNKAGFSERMKKLRNDPAFNAKVVELTKIRNADPIIKAALSEKMKKQNADPAFKAAASERLKKLHADPVFKAKMAEGLKRRDENRRAKKLASQQNVVL